MKHILALLLLLVTLPNLSTARSITQTLVQPAHRLVKNALAAAAPVLDVFQVATPVLTPFSNGTTTPSDPAACLTNQTLMVYSFANSYGTPFVGPYTPPACAFNRITLNLTVTAAGRQFDRLAVVYLGDTEIWRTSTAEPTADGIVWTYVKDVSHLLALWREPQTLIFDLGNIVDDTYTSPFNATLVASFFQDEEAPKAADQILTLSGMNGSSNAASAFQVPPQRAQAELTLPQNVKRAVFSLSANGQIDEEFWYTNVLSSQVSTFNASGTTLLGYGPFRELQLLIDGELAGVVWPFPIIFTGGIVPGFWRPIVGIDAFDLREDEVDVTPFLPVLCDGAAHSFEVVVAGIAEDGGGGGQVSVGVGSYWVVTGKVFVWLDGEGSVTTGTVPVVDAPSPVVSLSASVGVDAGGANSTISDRVSVVRELTVTGNVTTSEGTTTPSWAQRLSYSNENELSNGGATQSTTQTTDGTDSAPLRPYARRISYPLSVDSTFEQTNTTLTINGSLTRGEEIDIAGEAVFPTGLESFDKPYNGSTLSTTQNGTAYYLRSAPLNVSSGTTTQDFKFDGINVAGFPADAFPAVTADEELYSRHVSATNGTVTEDVETLEGAGIGGGGGVAGPVIENGFVAADAMKVLGRGGGSNTQGLPPGV